MEFLNLQSTHKFHGENGITGYAELGNEGAITDDTCMALFAAEVFMRAYTRFKEKEIDESLAECVRNACLSTLGNSQSSGGVHNNKTCGAVARMASAGLFFEPMTAYEFGCQFSSLTPEHPTCITASGAFAMLIAELLTGRSLNDSLDEILAFLNKQKDAVETANALQKARTVKSVSELGQGLNAEEMLAIGVYCALKNTWDFKKAVLEAVNITGNRNSTWAIIGNIIGTINGEKSIPFEWLSHLREKEIVSQVADDIWKLIEGNTSTHATKE